MVKNTIANTAYHFHLHKDYNDVAETIIICEQQMIIHVVHRDDDDCLIIRRNLTIMWRPKTDCKT